MYILTIEDTFAAAHQLREYNGKCENLHGHNWRVELRVRGNTLGHAGMLVDFGDLKIILKEILSGLDHKNLNDVAPFDAVNPTSENLARFIFEAAHKRMKSAGQPAEIYSVTVWESATSRCEYMP